MIITIARKFGSGGLEIGQRLAKRLNIPCYNADLLTGGSGDEQFAAIEKMAEYGSCVIVGFCADYVLRDRGDLIRVFIHGDMATRVARLNRDYNVPIQEAERRALQEDRERSRLYGAHTQMIWADLTHYDLTIDSGPLGISGTVELLSQFVALKVMRKRTGKGQCNE